MKHVKLSDVVEANNLIVSMGGEDQLPAIASAAIEKSLELQHRIERAVRYAEETHTSSLHARQILRILDGSITVDDEANEIVPEPVVHPLDEYPRLVRRPLAEAPAPAPAPQGRGMAGRSTKERKEFREWLAANGMDLPLNQTVPQHLLDDFDKETGRDVQRQKRSHHKKDKSPRGKLKPGHGLAGRSEAERVHIRDWLTQQGYDINPTGRIPQKYINHYDDVQAELKRMQRERQTQTQAQEEQGQEQEHAQGA
jgi:hypothetical protein